MTHVIVVLSALMAGEPAAEVVRVGPLELAGAGVAQARTGRSTGMPTGPAPPTLAVASATREANGPTDTALTDAALAATTPRDGALRDAASTDTTQTDGVLREAAPTVTAQTSVVPTNTEPASTAPANLEAGSTTSTADAPTLDAPAATASSAAPLSAVPGPALTPGEPSAALTAPEPVAQSVDHGRVRRFLGAFLGGVVGFGVPLALAPVFSCAGGASCLGAGQLALAFSSPLLGLTGSVAGYVAAGGQASAAGLGAIFPAALTTLGVMGAMSQMDPALVTSWLPAAIAGGAVLSLTSAALLTWREDSTVELDEGPGRQATSTRVRVAATIAASTAMALAGFVAVVGGTLACRSGCSTTVALTLSTLLLAGHAYATWAVHRALGGRAPAWSPLLLMALDLAATGLVALAAWLPGSTFGGFSEGARNGLALFTAAAAAVAGLSIAPMLVFEAMHTQALRSSKAGGLQVGLAPAPGGGLVTAGLAW